MTRGVSAAPFVTLNRDALKAFWEDSNGNELPSTLQGWDADSLLEGSAKVELHLLEVLKACGLPPTSRLRLGLSWHSQGTSLRGQAESLDLDNAEREQELKLKFAIHGANANGRLLLRLSLAYVGGAPTPGKLTPRIPGSVLWSCEREILLEGSGARFPMEWAEFSTSPAFPHAGLWLLDWDESDLHRPLLSCLRLYLNAESTSFAAAAKAQVPDQAQSVMLECLRFDVGRQLVLGALAMPELNPDEDYPDESFGAVLINLLRSLFPNESIQAVRERQKSNPRLFEFELQDKLGLFSYR